MFYCESCGIERDWPVHSWIMRSRGACEICNKVSVCVDVQSRALPTPKPPPPSWPKRHKMYIHSDKESNWAVGKQLGLSEEAIAEKFKYALYEVAVELDVNEDGSYTIVSFKE